MVKSKTEVEFHQGFGQDDIDKFIKRVPVYDQRHGHTIPPYVKFVQDGYKSYRTRNVTTIKFKFYFFDMADIEVLLYGTTFTNITTTVSTTAAITTTTGKYTHETSPRNLRNS